MRRARKGHVLVEIIVTMGIVSMLITASTSLISSASRAMSRTQAQVDVDSWATIGIQRMMEDLREAKRVEITNSYHMVIYYPLIDPATGQYDRTEEDPDATIEYYRSDDEGNEAAEGVAVWRKPAGQTGAAVVRRPLSSTDTTARPWVTNLEFESNNPSSVDVTLEMEKDSVSGSVTCNLEHRAIFLRNY